MLFLEKEKNLKPVISSKESAYKQETYDHEYWDVVWIHISHLIWN